MWNIIGIAWLIGTWYLIFIIESSGEKDRKKDLIGRTVLWICFGWVPVLLFIGVLPLSW